MITYLQFKSFVDSQSLVDMSGLSRIMYPEIESRS